MHENSEWISKEDELFFIKFYGDFEIFNFICNNLFLNFNKIIKNSFCISNKNLNDKTRSGNYFRVVNIINDFLNNNDFYKQQLELIYQDMYLLDIIFEIIDCYVYYLSKTNIEFYNIDIFNDKCSICYIK